MLYNGRTAKRSRSCVVVSSVRGEDNQKRSVFLRQKDIQEHINMNRKYSSCEMYEK